MLDELFPICAHHHPLVRETKQAIATNLTAMAALRTPIVTLVIGEGGEIISMHADCQAPLVINK